VSLDLGAVVYDTVFLGNDRLDAFCLNVFILRLYMFRAANAHHQEGQIVCVHQVGHYPEFNTLL
jgi:hypothetical protein